MNKKIIELFSDELVVRKIRSKLPDFFQLAEMESGRGGRIGMEVGSLRERILISLFMYYFGEENVKADLPITNPEADVLVFDKSVSIKTKTGSGLSGVKLIWTVDQEKARSFQAGYKPSCDMVFAHLIWDQAGALYYFPVETQLEIFNDFGRDNYIKLPVRGTNPRGVEISSTGLKKLINHEDTRKIEIAWNKNEIKYNKYERWLELWEES